MIAVLVLVSLTTVLGAVATASVRNNMILKIYAACIIVQFIKLYVLFR